MTEQEQRTAFEAWIKSPPHEKCVTRWPMDESQYSWPGQYRNYDVQLAWEAWSAAIRDLATWLLCCENCGKPYGFQVAEKKENDA